MIKLFFVFGACALAKIRTFLFFCFVLFFVVVGGGGGGFFKNLFRSFSLLKGQNREIDSGFFLKMF